MVTREIFMMTSSNGNIFRITGPFVRGSHRSPVNFPHKGQWRGALIFSLICAWMNGWINNREAGDLRRSLRRYCNVLWNKVAWAIPYLEIILHHICWECKYSRPRKSGYSTNLCIIFTALRDSSCGLGLYVIQVYTSMRPIQSSRSPLWVVMLMTNRLSDPSVLDRSCQVKCVIMITSLNNIFHVTGLMRGEYTGHWWIPLSKASEAELLCFL